MKLNPLAEQAIFEVSGSSHYQVLEVHSNHSKESWKVKVDERCYQVVQLRAGMESFSQAAAVMRLQELGLNQLDCLYHHPASGVEIYNWLAGEPLFTFDDPAPQARVSAEILERLIRKVAMIHSQTDSCFSPTSEEPSFIPEMVKRFYRIRAREYRGHILEAYFTAWQHLKRSLDRGLINNGVANRLEQVYLTSRPWIYRRSEAASRIERFSLVHGDLHPQNVICDQDNLNLIDFECCHYGDPALEIAFLFEQLTQSDVLNTEVEQELLEVYLQTRESPADNFLERYRYFKQYVLLKFVVLVADGLATPTFDEVNQPLFEHLLNRAEALRGVLR